MSFVKYEGLHNPNEVLDKIADYVKSRGYTIVQDVTADLNIYDMSSSDGNKFVFMDKSETYYIILRTANGTNIFGSDDATMDKTPKDNNPLYSGIGITVSEGYSKTQRWYNQYHAPNTWKQTFINGGYIPINARDSNAKHLYTLYCNNITMPSNTLLFSVVAENTDGNSSIGYDYKVVHIAVGNLFKYGGWNGGAFFSASSTPALMKDAAKLFAIPSDETASVEHFVTHDEGILPILSSGSISNTFLRIDIDDAIKPERGSILWASSGSDNITGKPLSLPIRVGDNTNGEIPHYQYMQSKSNLDWGRNINVLNCITLNMPIYFSIQVDSDALHLYSTVGQISGISFICVLNMQTANIYEMNYPKSGDTRQVFPFSSRRGRYGFDGMSVSQSEDDNASS